MRLLTSASERFFEGEELDDVGRTKGQRYGHQKGDRSHQSEEMSAHKVKIITVCYP